MAPAMDYFKDKNSVFNDLVDDTIGFNNNFQVLVTVGSGELRSNAAALWYPGMIFARFILKR